MNWLILGLEIGLVVLCTYAFVRVKVLSQRNIYGISTGQESRKRAKLSVSHKGIIDVDDDEIILEETRPYPQTSTTSTYASKQEALKRIQVFIGMQMLPVKHEFSELYSNNFEWLREAIAFYLIGASDVISKQTGCTIADRQQCIKLALQSQLRVDSFTAEMLHSKVSERIEDDDVDEMFNSGARAALQWEKETKVLPTNCLREQLNSWGVFA